VAALKTYGGLVNQPDYIGNAIFLHYTGDLNSYLELLFKPKLSSAIFFNFTSNNKSILFNSTLGKDGQLGGDVDGYLPPGLSQWAAQHVPGDVNFPPNLRQGATTSAETSNSRRHLSDCCGRLSPLMASAQQSI